MEEQKGISNHPNPGLCSLCGGSATWKRGKYWDPFNDGRLICNRCVAYGLMDSISFDFHLQGWQFLKKVNNIKWVVTVESQKWRKDFEAKRNRIPVELRNKIADIGICVYCGRDYNIQVDHKIPVSRGGTNDEWNLQPACGQCNASKGAKTHDEYLEHLKKGI